VSETQNLRENKKNMYTNKRTEAAIELINEFKTHDLTRKSSSEAVKPSRFKVTSKPPMPPTDPKTTPIPAPRNIKPNVGRTKLNFQPLIFVNFFFS
jgi:hypothetical protein